MVHTLAVLYGIDAQRFIWKLQDAYTKGDPYNEDIEAIMRRALAQMEYDDGSAVAVLNATVRLCGQTKVIAIPREVGRIRKDDPVVVIIVRAVGY